MILLIDNYDSFSYNLYQLVGSICPDIQVVRNDQVTVEDIRAMAPSHLLLSPGPGRPDQAGICEEAVRRLAGELPLLGICLGHQALCEALGGSCPVSLPGGGGGQPARLFKGRGPHPGRGGHGGGPPGLSGVRPAISPGIHSHPRRRDHFEKFFGGKLT